MVTFPRALGLCATLFVIGARAPAAPSAFVTAVVSPKLSIAPATVTLVITIPPDAENRELRWTCDGGLAVWSGRVALDGVDAPPRIAPVLRALPKGEYVCVVRVFNYQDEPAVAQAEFAVR
jgi:hypothetical protein